MERKKLSITVPTGEPVSAILSLPRDKNRLLSTGIITAHGAGNDMENPLLIAFTDGLAKAGYPSLRFNFPYKEKGLKAPDRPQKLEDTWAAVYKYLREESSCKLDRIVASGKSMGGRIASQMAADKKITVDALIFLGYPLHPADDQLKIRDAHLYRIEPPMLFFAGTRDRLCDLGKLQAVLNKLPAPHDLEIITGGDHSFRVPLSMGIKDSDIFAHIVQKTLQWLGNIF